MQQKVGLCICALQYCYAPLCGVVVHCTAPVTVTPRRFKFKFSRLAKFSPQIFISWKIFFIFRNFFRFLVPVPICLRKNYLVVIAENVHTFIKILRVRHISKRKELDFTSLFQKEQYQRNVQ